MQRKNKISLTITGLIFLLLITVGLSYAYFTANLTGGEDSTTITVTGGTMSMTFDGGNNITVANLLPSDSPVATKFFTGSNTTDLDMGYSLYLIVDDNTFSNYAIQYKLISENTGGSGEVILSNEELIPIKTGASQTLLGYGTYSSPTSGSKTHTYTLEIYFPSMPFNQNEDQGKEFEAHIGIEDYSLESDRLIGALDLTEKTKRSNMYFYFGDMLWEEYYNGEDKLSESELAELESLSNEYYDLGNAVWEDMEANIFLNTTLEREQIESIEFVDSNIIPVDVLGSFDVSEKQKDSVILWYEEGSSEDLYKVTIGQLGGVKAPIHADFLFFSLLNLTTITGNLKTDETRTMAGMFVDTGYNVETFNLDLSNWDTSKVTDMSGMFRYVGTNATTWSIGDISNWNTSKVTDMSWMFDSAGINATTWSIGDISNWNTSKVTNMSGMFDYVGINATIWTVGNLSNWNTSKVTNMSHMFSYAGYSATTWSIGYINNWDISKLINPCGLMTGLNPNANIDLNIRC